MRYSTIVVYHRYLGPDGRSHLTPYRVSKYNWTPDTYEQHVIPLSIAYLFRGHADWVNEQVKMSEARMGRKAA